MLDPALNSTFVVCFSRSQLCSLRGVPLSSEEALRVAYAAEVASVSDQVTGTFTPNPYVSGDAAEIWFWVYLEAQDPVEVPRSAVRLRAP